MFWLWFGVQEFAFCEAFLENRNGLVEPGLDTGAQLMPFTKDDIAISALTNTIDVPAAGSGPHNLVTSNDDTRLYATHTGDSDLVRVYDINGDVPVFLDTVRAGANPFGIAAVPAVPEPSGILLAIVGVMSLLRVARSH